MKTERNEGIWGYVWANEGGEEEIEEVGEEEDENESEIRM
jgi:hypothetical protein